MKNNTLYHDQRLVDPKRYKKKVDSWENSQMQLENLFKKISEVTTDAVLLTKPKLGTHDFFKALQLRLSRFFLFFGTFKRLQEGFLALRASQNNN